MSSKFAYNKVYLIKTHGQRKFARYFNIWEMFWNIRSFFYLKNFSVELWTWLSRWNTCHTSVRTSVEIPRRNIKAVIHVCYSRISKGHGGRERSSQASYLVIIAAKHWRLCVKQVEDRDRYLGIASELHMCTVTHCIHMNTRELTQKLEKIIYLKVLSWSFVTIDGFILL